MVHRKLHRRTACLSILRIVFEFLRHIIQLVDIESTTLYIKSNSSDIKQVPKLSPVYSFWKTLTKVPM